MLIEAIEATEAHVRGLGFEMKTLLGAQGFARIKGIADAVYTSDEWKRRFEILADYNWEKDRATIEETFAKLVKLVASLDDEQRRAAEEGLDEDELDEDELALFAMMTPSKVDGVYP